MAEKSITTQTEQVITKDMVKDMFTSGNGKLVTDAEAAMFIEQCKRQNIDPFLKEAYLIKYAGNAAQMITSVEFYKKRAFNNPDFQQLDSGIIVLTQKGEVVHREGTCEYPGDTTIGGWARVHQIRHGMDAVTYKEVSMSEYDKKQSLWKEKPGTMIAKVAIGQALREAFPTELNNTYIREEYDPEPIDVTPIEPEKAAEKIKASVAKKIAEKTETTPTEPVQAAETTEVPFPEAEEHTIEAVRKYLKENHIDEGKFCEYMASKSSSVKGLTLDEYHQKAIDYAIAHKVEIIKKLK